MDFSLISQTSLFRGYTPSETEELLRRLRASTRRFVRDSAVYTAGKPVSNIGIVLSGTAQIENNDIWGNTSILGLVKPGEVFAEAYAIEYSVQCCDDCHNRSTDHKNLVDYGRQDCLCCRKNRLYTSHLNFALRRIFYRSFCLL